MKYVFFCISLILTNLSFAQGETELHIDGITIPRLEEANVSPQEGKMYYDVTANEFRGRVGSQWVRLNSLAKSQTLVIPHSAFVPGNSDDEIRRTRLYAYINEPNSSTLGMFAGFSLPAGSVITSFSAALYDNSDTYDLNISLVRNYGTALNPVIPNTTASVVSTGSSNSFRWFEDNTVGTAPATSVTAYNFEVLSVDEMGIRASWPNNNTLRISKITVHYVLPD